MKEDGYSLECSADIPENKRASFLDSLLYGFPDLNISAVIISDFEGRDRSFWNTVTYKSAEDENGTRYFETESSTGWA